MKTIRKLLVIPLCCIFLFVCCSKENSLVLETEQMQGNVNSQSLIRAQRWIRDHSSATKTVSNWNPQWEDAFLKDISKLEIIEIPLSFLSEQIFVSEDCQAAYRATGKTKYLLNQTRLIYEYNKVTKQERAFLMTVSPSRKYLEKANFKLRSNSYGKLAKDFDGHIIYSNLNGQLISGRKYQNGQLLFYMRPQYGLLTKSHSTTTYCETTYTVHYIEWTYNNNDNVDYQYLYTEVSSVCWNIEDPYGNLDDLGGGGGNGNIPAEGEWWSFGHRLIFINALSRYLTDDRIDLICKGSKFVDTQQEPKNAYKHAMLVRGQTLDQGILALKDFFAEKARAFRLSNDYFALGEALHPIQDAYSPAHAFNEWSDTLGEYIPHGLENINTYPNNASQAIRETEQIYMEIIAGDASFDRMYAIFNAWYYRYQNP